MIFTPGPWDASRVGPLAITVRQVANTPDEKGLHVATVWGDKRTIETTNANARLIAEAPAMLEALRAIVGSWPPSKRDLDRARAILARIEGAA